MSGPLAWAVRRLLAGRGTIRNVPVVFILAAAAVFGGVILVALGRGGELTGFPPDFAPVLLDRVTATDVALLQPPKTLWGYQPQVTEEALLVIARAVTERDVEIERLRDEVARLRAGAAMCGDRPENPGQPAAHDD